MRLMCPICRLWYVDGLVLERRNSSALALELRLSCINPSIWNVQGTCCQGQVQIFIEIGMVHFAWEQNLISINFNFEWKLFSEMSPWLWSRTDIVDLNSLVPGKCGSDFKSVFSEHMLQIKFMSICEIALRWMPQNSFDDKSILVQVMAWGYQGTSN